MPTQSASSYRIPNCHLVVFAVLHKTVLFAGKHHISTYLSIVFRFRMMHRELANGSLNVTHIFYCSRLPVLMVLSKPLFRNRKSLTWSDAVRIINTKKESLKELTLTLNPNPKPNPNPPNIIFQLRHSAPYPLRIYAKY